MPDTQLWQVNSAETISTLLDWWRDNESMCPTMAVVARCFLSVPATSVQWKRLFPATGRFHYETETAAPPGPNAWESLLRFGNEISLE